MDDTINFGRHRGTPWTHVPISYLRWMLNQVGMAEDRRSRAQQEVDRRGTFFGNELELSAHSVDRASLYLKSQWERRTDQHEGIYTWLHRLATEAYNHRDYPEQLTVIHNDIQFEFATGLLFPTLVTVHPQPSSRRRQR